MPQSIVFLDTYSPAMACPLIHCHLPSAPALRSLPRFSSSPSHRTLFLPPLPPPHPLARNKLDLFTHSHPSQPWLPFPPLTSHHDSALLTHAVASSSADMETTGPKVFHGQCFVVENNIDTDQIIPAEYLTLVPSKPDEYEKLGSYAMVGLPDKYPRFVEEGKTKSKYTIVIAGSNFGCGSSREHAPVCLGASGVRVVVAESYARIFFRNSVATGALYPSESVDSRLAHESKTGDYVTVDMERSIVINHTQNKQYDLKPIGDAGPVIEAGGIFAYARKTGMIGASAS